ncbi:alpha/beta fold hydrolase [Vibrio sp. VB16]|uniref:alpha/beta fold hydrolase n=1 Tax=Vibrio sp. VB16 TaxID=2785746 RepID=UPI00189F8B7C|nr:alpha/beta hydrolase [Vibrio sp. VB16]UGA57508.1 alpha/beta hydrolase [Vibrio sp. VB16]
MIRWKSILLLFITVALICGENDDNSDWIEKKYSNEASEFVWINRSKVHYRDEGNGETVILIHGTSSSLHAWDKWTEKLKQEFRVVRMDLPGSGLTGHETFNQYEVRHDVVFLNTFYKKLGIESAHVVGSSLGGKIAWEYSLQYPDKVKSLTLINALGYPQHEWPMPIELAQLPVLDKIIENFVPKFIVKQSLKDVYFDQRLITEELVNRYYDMSLFKRNREAFTQRVKASLDTGSNRITKISVPTLILWGKEDIYFPVKNAFRFDSDIAISKAVIYENVGHLPMEEVPEKSLADFKQFVEDVPKLAYID